MSATAIGCVSGGAVAAARAVATASSVVADLGLELGGERALRRDEHEPEPERVDDQADGDEDVERAWRELPLHDESPAVLTSARIVN